VSDDGIKRIVNDYIKRVARLLPDNFETEDLLEDLKAHIYEGLDHKQQTKPSEDSELLVKEVLKELGTPEEIAEEYGRERLPDSVNGEKEDKVEYYLIRLAVALVVAVIAALIVDAVTDVIDFASAFFILVAFAMIEWFVRAKQSGDS
jgi:uncharacterized membrane protein